MAKTKIKTKSSDSVSVEDKLNALYNLQKVDSEIENIKTLRGELPLEIQDLEDEIVGLSTRIKNYQEEVSNLNTSINQKQNDIINSNNLIEKYKEQQKNVRNNREFDSLSKEIEFQSLEIELCEKKIKEFKIIITDKQVIIDESVKKLEERTEDLNIKKKELDDIIASTKNEESVLIKQLENIEKTIETRLLTAYKRIRNNARNGLAVVTVQRDACGGCFAKIPPQRQMDIKSQKKIIVCEYCGRILVDSNEEE